MGIAPKSCKKLELDGSELTPGLSALHSVHSLLDEAGAGGFLRRHVWWVRWSAPLPQQVNLHQDLLAALCYPELFCLMASQGLMSL
jgi:hypothetical protein